jgi:hypothetical protein
MSTKLKTRLSIGLIFTGLYLTILMSTASVYGQEPAWWTKQKRDCGLSPSLAYNTWVAQGMPCGGNRNQAPPTPDAGQVALENAVSRYNAVVSSLSDQYNILDKQGWRNLPHGTEAQFLDTANQLHKFLVNYVDKIETRVAGLKRDLAVFDEINRTYPGLIANLNTESERLRSERDRVANSLKETSQQLEITNRAARQLGERANLYQISAEKDRKSVLMWFDVLLPPNAAKNARPGPYQSAIEWAPSIMERQRPVEAAPLAVAITPAKPMLPRRDIDPARLEGSPEEAAAQLETDAARVRSSSAGNTWDLANAADRARTIAERLQQDRISAIETQVGVESDVFMNKRVLKELTIWSLPKAQDELQAAQQSFLYRAADAWIWKNARSEAIRQLKVEMKRLAVSSTTGVRYRDVTNLKIQEFFDAGKRNIFGFTDKAITIGGGMKKVTDRIRTLQTHSQGFIFEAARLGSSGTPAEINEFQSEMSQGIDGDCEELVKANLSAIKIPDPWNSIVSKYFIKRSK